MRNSKNIGLMAGVAAAAFVIGVTGSGLAEMEGHRAVVEASKAKVPAGPWPAGDQVGSANAIGPGTWQRCAYHLTAEGAKAYEISYLRTTTMPMSPFGGDPLKYEYRPPSAIPGTKHIFTGEHLSGNIEDSAQGTQMDALGHFAYLDEPWDGQGAPPADKAKYYGGYTAKDVKPSADSPCSNSASRMFRRSSHRPCCWTPRPIWPAARR